MIANSGGFRLMIHTGSNGTSTTPKDNSSGRSDGHISVRSGGGGGSFPFLFLIRNTSSFGLSFSNLTEVNPDGTCGKWVRFRAAAVLLVGGSEPSDQGVEAAPSLLERAGAGGRRVRVTEIRTTRSMDFSLPELVQILQEFDDVSATATR